MGFVGDLVMFFEAENVFAGTMLLVFLLGGAAIGLSTADQSPFATLLYASLSNWLALSIFILCLGPVSGAHLSTYVVSVGELR